MEKTIKLQVNDAYRQGFNDCKREMVELEEKISKWQAAPETELAYWIGIYVSKKLKEMEKSNG